MGIDCFNFVSNTGLQTTKTLDLKVYLEGLMPLSGPVLMNQAQGASGAQFDPGIADQVTVELHEIVSPYEISALYPAMTADLHTDGTLSVTLPGTITGLYYIVIKHRNSIETWSQPGGYDFGTTGLTYDFTTAASQAYGDNLMLKNGVYVIFGGNPDMSDQVDGSDMLMIDNASQPPVLTGYYPEDIDGSGSVDGSDMLIIDNNSQPPVATVKRP